MSVVSIRAYGGEWEVWLSLDDGTKAPAGLSFVIGVGATRDEAVADAVKDLEAKIQQLQQPAVHA